MGPDPPDRSGERPGPSGGAVAGSRDVDPPDGVLGQQLDRDRLGRGVGFVAQHVHVTATGVDEAGSGGVDLWPALGVAGRVVGHRAGDDEDQAGSGMRVPAGGRAGRELVVDDVDVGPPWVLSRAVQRSAVSVWALTWILPKTDLAMAVRMRVRWRDISPPLRSGRW